MSRIRRFFIAVLVSGSLFAGFGAVAVASEGHDPVALTDQNARKHNTMW
jgi:hypothetical protein